MLIQSEIPGVLSKSGVLFSSKLPRMPPLRDGVLTPSQLPVSPPAQDWAPKDSPRSGALYPQQTLGTPSTVGFFPHPSASRMPVPFQALGIPLEVGCWPYSKPWVPLRSRCHPNMVGGVHLRSSWHPTVVLYPKLVSVQSGHVPLGHRWGHPHPPVGCSPQQKLGLPVPPSRDPWAPPWAPLTLVSGCGGGNGADRHPLPRAFPAGALGPARASSSPCPLCEDLGGLGQCLPRAGSPQALCLTDTRFWYR